jgi:hypothetical protein
MRGKPTQTNVQGECAPGQPRRWSTPFSRMMKQTILSDLVFSCCRHRGICTLHMMLKCAAQFFAALQYLAQVPRLPKYQARQAARSLRPWLEPLQRQPWSRPTAAQPGPQRHQHRLLRPARAAGISVGCGSRRPRPRPASQLRSGRRQERHALEAGGDGPAAVCPGAGSAGGNCQQMDMEPERQAV